MQSLLIRAEDKNAWERRAPVIPEDVQDLKARTGAGMFVQRSEKRFFPEDDYERAGAALCDSMEPGQVILGIKEIPREKLLKERTYCFFSHTIKGQAANMPLLRQIMADGSTLIDYERIVDEKNRRLVYFGRYAGDAGALDILALMGKRWEEQGLSTPFARCRPAVEYASVQEAREHLQDIGRDVREKGLPVALGPLVIAVLGYGNVSSGAQQIFDCLPVQRIAPQELRRLAESRQLDPQTIYLSIFQEQDLVRPKQGEFDLQEYYAHPEQYESCFHEYLPWISLLVNAIYWDSRYPRFVSWEDLEALFTAEPTPKLSAIADISCDVGGAVECNVKTTDSGQPSYVVQPLTREVRDGYTGEGIVVLAVDNLPAEIPNDSSTFFSKQLSPFLPSLLEADFAKPLEHSGLCPELQRAVIVYKGKLTPAYEYLEKLLNPERV